MKIATNIAGGLLGLAFIAFSLMYFFKMMPNEPGPPEGSPPFHFMAAFGPTGYMDFVKVCELLGGILVAIPLTRNWGLLLLGPVLVNIIAFHVFLAKGEGLLNPPVIPILGLLSVFLLWSGRAKFLGLLNRPQF